MVAQVPAPARGAVIGRLALRLALLTVVPAAAVSAPVEGGPSKVKVGAYDAYIYAPAPPSPPRALPVVLFVGGAGGIEPAQGYSELLSKVADHGFLVVGLDRESLIDYPLAGRQFLDVLAWAQRQDGLAKAVRDSGSSISLNISRLSVMGQSSGNHILGMALGQSCSAVQAWVMIDPVDGFDPFRIVKSEDLITPGQKLNFTLPALMLDNGLDPSRDDIPGFPPCAPPNLSNDRFYDAMRGPIWAINATAYGHMDCMDTQGFLCPTNKSTDKAAYKGMLAQASATFLGALFGSRPRIDLALLEDASDFDISVVTKHDLKGLAHDEIRPGCTSASAPPRARDSSFVSAALVV